MAVNLYIGMTQLNVYFEFRDEANLKRTNIDNSLFVRPSAVEPDFGINHSALIIIIKTCSQRFFYFNSSCVSVNFVFEK